MNRNPEARKTLGEILRAWRAENGLSQEELAARADFDRTYVGSVERGETNLSFEGIWQFLHGLNRSWSDLGRCLDAEPALRRRPITRSRDRALRKPSAPLVSSFATRDQ